MDHNQYCFMVFSFHEWLPPWRRAVYCIHFFIPIISHDSWHISNLTNIYCLSKFSAIACFFNSYLVLYILSWAMFLCSGEVDLLEVEIDLEKTQGGDWLTNSSWVGSENQRGMTGSRLPNFSSSQLTLSSKTCPISVIPGHYFQEEPC